MAIDETPGVEPALRRPLACGQKLVQSSNRGLDQRQLSGEGRGEF